MKKLLTIILSLSLIGAYAVLPAHANEEKATETISYTYDAGRWTTRQREMEKLDRGLVAVNTGSGVYLSWRLFDSEDNRFGSAKSNVSFNIYRDGGSAPVATVTDSTNYTDKTVGSSYQVAPVIDGNVGEKCNEVTVNDNNYFDINLVVPEAETLYDPSGNLLGTYSFSPADCSTGDLDGDGEYEIIVKWTSMPKDVGSPGDSAYSGTVRLAAYKLSGERLWKNDINLGKNVYSSEHTVQFLVYDFNLDGKAELITQTSLGSTDAAGVYVSHAADPVSNSDIYSLSDTKNADADYRGDGRIVTGEEFLTVFNGETGEAIDTINLPTSRGGNNGIDYGDNFGNRSNRFMASVAYLDGERPYAVYSRGYYFAKEASDVRLGNQRTSIAGISFDGQRLNAKYRFDTKVNQPGYVSGDEKFAGNGNHNCTVADVDNDGKDEYIIGALCVEVDANDALRPKWCSFLEHGDAMHIGDYDPTHEGFEFFTVQEDGGPNYYTGVEINYGMTVIDPGISVTDPTDENYKKLIMFHNNGPKDTGRGLMANVGSGGYYQIIGSNSGNFQSNGGTNFASISNGMSMNFRIFWDGDLYDELLDGTDISKWRANSRSQIYSLFDASSYGCVQINGTKANPSLQADLFGDWREEVVYPTSDGSKLRVFTTTEQTNYKIKTLMHDPVYRSGVAAEQTAYNQPPHVGIYLGTELFGSPFTGIEVLTPPDKTVYALGDELDTTGMIVQATREDKTQENVSAYKVTGFDSSKSGEQTLTVSYQGYTDTFKVTIKSVASISVTPPTKTAYSEGQDLNTAGMEVTVIYTDNSTGTVPLYSCEISGFDPSVLGEQTVTVKYANKSASFKVQVLNPNISLINGTYETASTATSHTDIGIGEYYNNFTIEHTVTINSMPANGSNNKSYDYGFVMKFNPPDGTGGGWYITNSNGKANIFWKATSAVNVAKNLNIGQTYTFKYAFSNVGTGAGAKVTLTITDADGNCIGGGNDLNLRNMTNDNQKVSPLGIVQIFNQANANSTASVTIADAKLYNENKIVSVSGRSVTVNMQTLSATKIYAASYADGVLSNIAELKPEALGESTLNADFEPDKVFMWTDDMYPLDFWEDTSTAPSSYEVSVTVLDSNNTPVPNATVRLREIQPSSSGDDDGSIGEVVLNSVNMTAVTDENGVASFTDVPSGAYRVYSTYTDLGTAMGSVTLQSVSPYSCTIKFSKALN